MPKNYSSVKAISNPILTAFANEEFIKNLFFHLAIFCLLMQSLVQPMALTVPASLKQISVKSFISFEPSLDQNSSSLFSASPRRRSSTGILLCKMPVVSKTSHLGLVFKRSNLAPGFEWQSFALPSNPFSLKSAVKADFLTLEPTNLTATTGDINLSATNNLNIVSAANTYLREEQSSKQGTTIMKASIDIKQDLINVASNLNAGNNIVINSGADTNLIGTKLTAANDIAISAGGELGIYAVADQHYRYQNSVKTRSFATIAKYTGVSLAMDTMNDMLDMIDKISVVSPVASLMVVKPLTSISRGSLGYYQNLAEGDFSSKSQTKVTQDTIYQKANLTAGNNLSLIANNNINLVGVDLSAINNNITDGTSGNQSGNGTITSLNGDVAIINVKDSHQESLETHKSRTTLTSIAAGSVKNTFLIASTSITAVTILKNPFDKQATYKENEAAMKDTLKKSQTHISQITDETIIASNLNFTGNLNISSGNNTNITSSNLNAGNNLNINSRNSTTINTAAENDSTFTLTEKKSPNIFAAFSNGFVQLFAAAMPDFTPWKAKKDSKEGRAKTERENDSLGHQAHRIDFDTATADKSKAQAMIEGYTISNNDAKEMAYDLDLNKTTTRTKTNIASNLSAGNDLNITSNNQNNLIVGSNLAATNNINLNSLNGKTIITSAQDESFYANSTVDQAYNKMSFETGRGRIGASSTSNVNEADTKTTNLTQKESRLISGGNINIMSKDNINILASNLSSNGQINLTSTQGNVNILTQSNNSNFASEIRDGTLTLSATIGHSAIDSAYAVDDTVKAAEALKDAKENLSKMKQLHKEGKAEKDAVDDAEVNLTMATLNVTLAALKAYRAAEKAYKSSIALGFNAEAQLTRTGQKTNTNSSNAEEIGSNLLAKNSILINSGALLTDTQATQNRDLGNTNVKGSLTSADGDIIINSKNDTNITALKSTSKSSTKSQGFTQSISLGSSTGASPIDALINTLSAQIGTNSSKSDSSSTTYTNTTLLAENGTLKINSGNDANIKGADLLAKDIILNTVNNLNIESLQNQTRSKSKSSSANGGGGANSVIAGFNYQSDKFERDWVDDQTSVIGTNSVQINTGGNTHNKGALIANISNATAEDITSNSSAEAKQKQANRQANWIDGNNLTLNTGTLTFENIYDREEKKSVGYGMQTNFTIGGGNAADSKSSTSSTSTSSSNSTTNNQNIGTVQSTTDQSPDSTTITARNEGYKKEQTTKATIGSGTITVGATQTFDANGNFVSSAGGTVLTSNDPQIASLNRDIASTQIITKDTITGALDVKVTVSHALVAKVVGGITNAVVDGVDKFLKSSEEATQNLSKQNVKELIEEVNKDRNININKMSSEEKADLLAGLAKKAGKEDLEPEDIKLRDAIYVSLTLDPKYVKFRDKIGDKVIEKVVSNSEIIKDLKNWENLDADQKVSLLQKVNNIQQKMFGNLDVASVYAEEGLRGNYGGYNPIKDNINLNSLYFDDKQETVDTIFHEGNHETVNYLSTNKKFIKNNKDLEIQMRIFSYNLQKDSTAKGLPMYSREYYGFNPVEQDGWQYGLNMKNKLNEAIKNAKSTNK